VFANTKDIDANTKDIDAKSMDIARHAAVPFRSKCVRSKFVRSKCGTERLVFAN
jgi:hypothetical protein